MEHPIFAIIVYAYAQLTHPITVLWKMYSCTAGNSISLTLTWSVSLASSRTTVWWIAVGSKHVCDLMNKQRQSYLACSHVVFAAQCYLKGEPLAL